MKGIKITSFLIIALVAIIAIFDFWVIAEHGKQASISAVIIRWSYDYPSIPFLLGFVCGHLFWRMKDADVKLEK